MYSLKDKTAVVTGGGSGIGKAICQLFSHAGAKVFILDIDEQGSVATVEQIRQSGGDAQFLRCAVDQAASVEQAIAHIVNIQVPDILVNNAGIAHIGNAENTSTADFEKLFSVNVKGV